MKHSVLYSTNSVIYEQSDSYRSSLLPIPTTITVLMILVQLTAQRRCIRPSPNSPAWSLGDSSGPDWRGVGWGVAPHNRGRWTQTTHTHMGGTTRPGLWQHSKQKLVSQAKYQENNNLNYNTVSTCIRHETSFTTNVQVHVHVHVVYGSCTCRLWKLSTHIATILEFLWTGNLICLCIHTCTCTW